MLAKPASATAMPTPKITATSMTSRFHVDVITTASQEIDMKQVNLAIGNQDMLTDAHLRIKAGVRYGLVGRNGEGKSTLLKSMSEKIIPGLPDNLRIHLVSQVEGTDAGFTAEGTTVLQRVLASDKLRESALREQKILSEALEGSEVDAIAEAVAKLQLERLQDELVEAQKIANKRSGARGADARKQLLKAEAAVAEAEKRVEAPLDNGVEEAVATAGKMLEEVQTTLDTMDAASAEARAQVILLGLGFTPEMISGKFSALSGGWRSRASLASALLQQVDVLLLDEPTNYLDLDAVIWLTLYLQSLSCSIVIVAHDRDFLDSTCEETIILRDKKLTYFEGGLTNYERDQRKKRKGMIRSKEARDRRKGDIEKSIQQGARRAKETGDQTLQSQVKMRKKKLETRWGVERNEKGHRFKLNRDLQGFHLTSREEVQIDELEREVAFPFIDPEPMRNAGTLFSVTGVSFRYSTRTPYVLQNVDLKVHPGSRVALIGRNGQGKSTLVKLLTGKIKPTVGTVEHHPRLRFGLYDQHSVEAFSAPEFTAKSAVQHFIETMKTEHSRDVTEATARSYLGSYGLQGKKATNSIATLSGGQRVRLALAVITYPAPDVLVLDEPNTHLDLYANAALLRALKSFAGAIVLVTHDRHLVRCVVEGAPILPPSEMPEDDESEGEESEEEDAAAEPGRTLMVSKGQLKLMSGVDAYVALVEKRVRKKALA